MSKKETKLIGNVLLTKDEVQEAFSYLFDEYGPSIQLWTTDRQTKEISNYWLDRGKENMLELLDAQVENNDV